MQLLEALVISFMLMNCRARMLLPFHIFLLSDITVKASFLQLVIHVGVLVHHIAVVIQLVHRIVVLILDICPSL
jgi:hypothetical protein